MFDIFIMRGDGCERMPKERERKYGTPEVHVMSKRENALCPSFRCIRHTVMEAGKRRRSLLRFSF